MRMFIGCLALLLATSAFAQSMSEDQATIKSRCAQYAREDQVPDKELSAYMQDCIDALSEPQPDDKPTPTPTPPSPQD